MALGQDKEIQEYRDMMKIPDRFEDGFGWKTVIGALFLGIFMLPGSMYLSLVMGGGLGSAAQWVTVILFAEVAKRSLKSLRQQEVYVLYYMAGIALASPFQGFLWNQYFVQSPAAISEGIADQIPSWVAPSRHILKETGRTFFNKHWLAPLAMVSCMLVIQRIDRFGLGYALYRLTSRVEKLPFPMAPVGAQGIMALAGSQDPAQRWRWRCFSIGGLIGLMFGLVYVGVPSLTGAFLAHPLQIIPIPWLDLMSATERILPAAPVNLVFDLGLVLIGMVLPFWAIVGGAVGLLIMFLVNPFVLHKYGLLPTWREGMKVVDTVYSNTIDFYLSFGVGITLSIAAVSFYTVLKPLFAKRKETAMLPVPGEEEPPRSLREIWRQLRVNYRERGDIDILISIAIYFFSTASYIGISTWLVDGFPWFFFLPYAFIYTPLISYTTAKLEGMVGQAVAIPLVREAAFILSGYKGAAIWFAPIPIHDYGTAVQFFRVVELTGTKLTSIIKTELVTIPVVIVCSFLFAEVIWRLAPVPSDAYPFAQQMWHLNAMNSCLTISATMEGSSRFMESINPSIIALGFGGGLTSFILLSLFGMPTFLIYGLVRGLGHQMPGGVLTELIGALLGRFYFERKFGREKWRKYAPVMLAGFACGLGLISMGSIGVALIAKSTTTLAY